MAKQVRKIIMFITESNLFDRAQVEYYEQYAPEFVGFDEVKALIGVSAGAGVDRITAAEAERNAAISAANKATLERDDAVRNAELAEAGKASVEARVEELKAELLAKEEAAAEPAKEG